MYTQFFGLKEKPFSITPDPRYLFMSKRHAEAFAHLMYGINEAGGFVQLTGEIGAGKTTLVRSLLEQLPKHADVAAILNPRVTPQELLLSICQDVGMTLPESALQSLKSLVDALNTRLLEAHAKGRRTIVIVDEAQSLSTDTLEQVRLLTNLETASTKLLQIILIGQPELRDILAHSTLKQLAQRIVGRYHLTPLSRDETVAYIQHRLKIAGATTEIFTPGALREVHRIARGVPRVINTICDRALLGAYSIDKHRVDTALVRRAASEVFDRAIASRGWQWAGAAMGLVGVAVLATGLRIYFSAENSATDTVAQTTSTQTAPAPPVAASPGEAVTDAEILLANPALGISSSDSAFAALFQLWRAKFDPTQGRACDQAAQQGLECVYQKGSYGQLRLLNRPAILSLADSSGQTHQAVLSRLQDDTAHIDMGSGPVKVTLASLSRVWLGEYLIVWRPEALGQALGQRALAKGMQGDEVRSLRRGLAALDGGEPALAAQIQSDVYDDELARRIEQFQRAHRLNVDGIAGVQTQIVLDSLVNNGGAPLLLDSQKIDGRQPS